MSKLPFFLFDSAQNKKIEFIPENPDQVKIYSCGPTVYNYSHIGNLRSYIFVDILRRTLKILGYQLDQTMNITDIDDKIIRESIQHSVSIEEFTKPWTEAFFRDLEKLNIEKLEHYPFATKSVEEMVELIEKLQENGYTYEKEGSIYFSIDKLKSYGSLSKVEATGIISGARYDADEYEKDNVRDFVLWKAPKEEQEKSWNTKIGNGRPGWHLECSAMIRQIYSSGVDIHTGGIDLLFPHHENEKAQSEAAYPNEKFVKYWMHCEHLLVDGQKMSKSKGNFFVLNDILDKGYDWKVVRYVLLSFHYRTKLNFSFERLNEAKVSIQKIQNAFNRISSEMKSKNIESIRKPINHSEIITSRPQEFALEYFQNFVSAISDDLNLPKALASIFDSIKSFNTKLDSSSLSNEEMIDVLKYFYQIDCLLGILDFNNEKIDNLNLSENEILTLIENRTNAKKNKDFKLADSIRDELKAKGIILEDSKDGSVKWKKAE
ncbi:MAG: cysteine--tRNA ligase [Leptospira sp.]|nr:MAG: cysteine--tRNA ligase [Leptospira sp.]